MPVGSQRPLHDVHRRCNVRLLTTPPCYRCLKSQSPDIVLTTSRPERGINCRNGQTRPHSASAIERPTSLDSISLDLLYGLHSDPWRTFYCSPSGCNLRCNSGLHKVVLMRSYTKSRTEDFRIPHTAFFKVLPNHLINPICGLPICADTWSTRNHASFFSCCLHATKVCGK